MVLALFCFTPSGIMSRMSCITAARSSRSKCDSMRCLVTVFAIPCKQRVGGRGGKEMVSEGDGQGRAAARKQARAYAERKQQQARRQRTLDWRPSNWRASRLPSQRSSRGTMPRRKKSQTRHMGAQKPTPGPCTYTYTACGGDRASVRTQQLANKSHATEGGRGRELTALPHLATPLTTHTPASCQSTHPPTHLAHGAGVEAVVHEVLEVLAHAHLAHELVLVAVHACGTARRGEISGTAEDEDAHVQRSVICPRTRELADVREGVLQAVRQLVGVDVAQAELHVGVHHQLGEAQDLHREGAGAAAGAA